MLLESRISIEGEGSTSEASPRRVGEHWHPEASWRLSCLRIDPKSESWVWRVGELKEKGVPLTRQKECVTCRPLCSPMTQFCAYWHQVPLQTDNQDSHDNTVTLGTAQYYRYYYERMITHLALQRAVCALHSLQALHGPYSPRFGVPLTFRTGWHDNTFVTGARYYYHPAGFTRRIPKTSTAEPEQP